MSKALTGVEANIVVMLEELKDQSYWEEAYNMIPEWNEKIKLKRGQAK